MPALPRRDLLTLLVVFHYLLAVLLGLLAFIPSFYAAVGYSVLSGSGGPNAARLPAGTGWTFVAIGVAGMLATFAYGVMLAVTAHSISTRRRPRWVVASAVVSCLVFPLGTVLGLFTLHAMRREEVRLLFASSTAP
jgi:hypothetical protein